MVYAALPRVSKKRLRHFFKVKGFASHPLGYWTAKPAKNENHTVFLHCDAHAVEPDLKSRAAALDDPKVFDSLSRLTLYAALALIKDFILLCFIPR